jgi:hypothetical protein
MVSGDRLIAAALGAASTSGGEMTQFTAAQEEWIASCPPCVQEKVRAYPPTQLYRNKVTNQLVRIESYEESADGTRCETCRVTAWQEWAPELTAVGVFGMHFTDLTPIETTHTVGEQQP